MRLGSRGPRACPDGRSRRGSACVSPLAVIQSTAWREEYPVPSALIPIFLVAIALFVFFLVIYSARRRG